MLVQQNPLYIIYIKGVVFVLKHQGASLYKIKLTCTKLYHCVKLRSSYNMKFQG